MYFFKVEAEKEKRIKKRKRSYVCTRMCKAGRSITIYGIGLDRCWGVVVEFFLVIYLLISMVQEQTDAGDGSGGFPSISISNYGSGVDRCLGRCWCSGLSINIYVAGVDR